MKEIQKEPWRAGQGVFSQQCVTLTHRAINIASNKFQIAVWLSFNNRRAYVDLRTKKNHRHNLPLSLGLRSPRSRATSCCMSGWGETTVAVPADTLTSWTSFACLRSERRYGDWRWGANDFQRTKAAPRRRRTPNPFAAAMSVGVKTQANGTKWAHELVH